LTAWIWLARDIALRIGDPEERERRLDAIDELLKPPTNERNETGAPRWYGSDEDAWAAFEAFAAG